MHPSGVFQSANAPGCFDHSKGRIANPAHAELVAL
jgi:hypothetical protein